MKDIKIGMFVKVISIENTRIAFGYTESMHNVGAICEVVGIGANCGGRRYITLKPKHTSVTAFLYHEDDLEIVGVPKPKHPELKMFENMYKRTRNYTILTEDYKLTDDQIFGGLLEGKGRACVYSAWEVFLMTVDLSGGRNG